MKKNKRTRVPLILSLLIICLVSALIGFKFNEVKGSKSEGVSAKQLIAKQQKAEAERQAEAEKQAEIDRQAEAERQAEIDRQAEAKRQAEAEAEAQAKAVQAVAAEKVSTNVVPNGSKVVFLTFDDGPSPNVTPLVLNVLKNENVKATFFVVGSSAEKYPSLLKQVKAEGHAIGNHSYSHDYKYIYSATSNFLSDFKKGDNAITAIIGDHNRELIRFPGGSFNKQAYQQVAKNAGYHYVDWNCLPGDAEVPLASVERLMRRFKETYSGQKELIILMHDASAKTTTPEALPGIIKFLKAQGYEFKTL